MKTARLADLCSLVTDGTHYTPADIGSGIPFLTVTNMTPAGLDFANCSRISAEDFAAARAGNSAPQSGDVLFSKDGTVGKVCVVDTSEEFAVLSSIAILRPRDKVDSNYLGQMLRTPEVLAQATSLKSGSAVRRIILSALKQVEIPLPALEEQRRVAAILDHADALRDNRRQALANLDALTQAIFHDMFGDPARWDRMWPMGRIVDLASSIAYGTSAKAGSAGEWPVLRMGNVTDDGRIDLTDLKYIDLSAVDIPKYTIRRGDLLFNRTNSKEKVGKTAVVHTDAPLALAGYLVRVRFKPGNEADFVSAYLGSPHGVRVRQRLAKAAVNQANISASVMREIPIAMPPASVQSSFAERLRRLREQRDFAVRADSEVQRLFASLQSRAFSGDL